MHGGNPWVAVIPSLIAFCSCLGLTVERRPMWWYTQANGNKSGVQVSQLAVGILTLPEQGNLTSLVGQLGFMHFTLPGGLSCLSVSYRDHSDILYCLQTLRPQDVRRPEGANEGNPVKSIEQTTL